MRSSLLTITPGIQAALELSVRRAARPSSYLQEAFGLNPQEAVFVELMYRAHPAFTAGHKLTDALPKAPLGNGKRIDPNYRTVFYAGTIVHGLRKKLGRAAIETKKHTGYRLGSAMAARVAKILEPAQ